MPIYEYKCDKCKKQFEVVTMSMSEKADVVCPKCKSKKVSKMMSSFGYASKGSGSSAGAGSSGCSSCGSSSCSSCGH